MSFKFSQNHNSCDFQQLSEAKKLMKSVLSQGYSDPAGFVNLPTDFEYQKAVTELAQEKLQLKPELLLLVGIGGSNLGTLAVHEALHGKQYNATNPDMQLYCADTLDPDKNEQLKNIITHILESGGQIIITVVTKSGTTTETTANAALFIDILKQYRPDDYQNYIVMITDKGSALDQVGNQIGSSVLEIPKNVGGRFSVLSAVGLFPLAMLGVDVSELCAGAAEMSNFEDAAVSAAFLFEQKNSGIMVHDTFIFDDACESLGKWYRQLMAESIGKQGKGMLPTVSMGTVDLHSMAQLYLGGPKMSCTTFVSVVQNHDQIIPDAGIAKAAGSSMVHVQQAIIKGVQAAYVNEKKPFVTIDISRDARSIGHFLQFKMLEIVYLSFLMQVNPFDQPQVELYKQEVRKFLSND